MRPVGVVKLLELAQCVEQIGAELGSPLPELGQFGPQAPDVVVDERQLRPGVLFADVT
jgi:hypothetical protein